MMKVKGIKNFGIWLKKGKETICNNSLGLMVIETGRAEFIKYIDKGDKRINIGEKEMNKRIKKLKKYNIPMKSFYSFKHLIEIIEKVEKWKKKN
ncbi:MAG: hypothetical protein ACFFDN_06925 [Candidatus Hodarchaeota archaeon]